MRLHSYHRRARSSRPRGREHRFAYLGLAVALLLPGTATMAEAQTAPPDEPPVEQSGLDPAPGGDPTSPPVVLPPVIERLQRLSDDSTASPGRRRSLVLATKAAEGALVQYTDGSTDLGAVIAALGKAGRNLQAIRPRDDGDGRELASLAADLGALARTLAADVVEVAAAAGVDLRTLQAARAAMEKGDARLAAGNVAGAAKSYGEGLKLSSGGLHFDLDTFEAKIREIGPEVGGYAYTIGVGGQLARSGAEGQARTDADSPATDQSPDKEQFLASVSKTITGVAMLRALQDRGISVESPIAPFLPPSWTLGAGAENLSFRDLFNHKSGFASNVGNTFAGLEARIAQPFPALPTSFAYSNANFGLIRILIPRMTGTAQTVAFLDQLSPDLDAAAATLFAGLFQQYVQSTIFEPIGIDGQCSSNDGADETRYYNFPPDGSAGVRRAQSSLRVWRVRLVPLLQRTRCLHGQPALHQHPPEAWYPGDHGQALPGLARPDPVRLEHRRLRLVRQPRRRLDSQSGAGPHMHHEVPDQRGGLPRHQLGAQLLGTPVHRPAQRLRRILDRLTGPWEIPTARPSLVVSPPGWRRGLGRRQGGRRRR